MPARGRPRSPALIEALHLVVQGYPVYAAAQAVQVSPSLLFRKLLVTSTCQRRLSVHWQSLRSTASRLIDSLAPERRYTVYRLVVDSSDTARVSAPPTGMKNPQTCERSLT